MSLDHVLPECPIVPEPLSGNDAVTFVVQAAHYAQSIAGRSSLVSVQQIVHIADALRRVPAEVLPESRVAALVGLAQHCYVSGYPMVGIEPAVEALNASRQLKEPIWRLRALNVLAVTLGDTVDVGGAVEYLTEALELVTDRTIEASLWGNLGGALFFAGHQEEAKGCHLRSAALGEERPSVVAAAQTNLALIALHQQRVADGLVHARQAIEALPNPIQPNDLLNRVLAETYYARLLIEISDYARAAQRVDIAKELAATSGSARAQHAAEVAEGLCEVARGQHDIGLSRLNALLDKARAMRTALRDTLHALIAAYRYLDQPHRADVHVRELTFLARRSQTDYLRSRREALERRAQERSHAALPARQPSSVGEPLQLLEVLERLAVQAESADDASGLHIFRVGALSALLAAEIGLTEETVASMEVAGRLHDIGKWPLLAGMRASPNVAISEQVRERLKLHAEVGEELLSQVDATITSLAREAARSHHERWDGLGYPDGLAGAIIPLAGRIVAIANEFESIAFSTRGRGTQSLDRALDELVQGRATRFDPELVDAFVAMIDRLRDEDPRWQEQLIKAAGRSNYLRSRERIGQLLARPATL